MDVKTSNILVVDDEPDLEPLVRQRMRRHIRSGRYSFSFASNGAEALEHLMKDKNIDMVLSDINMPVMDGLTLLERIPAVNPDIRSVIMSAYGDMANIRTAMNRGAFDFITKPVDFKDLQVTIDRTLRHVIEWREARASRDRLAALQNELTLASRMQQSILTTEFPTSKDYEVFANMEPARNVGGDFYDLIYLKDGRIGLTVADVSDKGVPAALFMMSSHTLIKSIAQSDENPGLVLESVNNLLHENNDSFMFVTVIYAIYDPATGELTYACGGHDSPVLVHNDGSSTLLPPTGGVSLGLVPDLKYSEHTVPIAPGDAAVFFTDGVTEAENIHEEMFGISGIQSIFHGTPPKNAVDPTMSVFKAVNDFEGDTPRSDDATCLTLFRTEVDS